MKKKLLLIILAIGFFSIRFLFAQDKAVPEQYNRSALTYMLLDNGGKYSSDLKQAIEKVNIPEKFDDNNLSTRYFSSSESPKTIKSTIINNHYPNDIVAKWFDRKDDGTLDMTIIHKRGQYNATDQDALKAQASKLGMAKLKDAGQALVNNSHILVLSYKNIITMKEHYDKVDKRRRAIANKTKKKFKPVKRIKNGFMGDVTAYLYKIDFNDSIYGVLYDQLWIYDDDDAATKQKKKELFDKTQFPLKFVMKVNGKADGSQYNPGQILAPKVQKTRDELFQQLVSTGGESAIFMIERKYEPFRVKVPVYTRKPIGAKVGLKEGLKFDQRYFVLEYRMNDKNEMITKRRAVVRSKSVIDNRKMATGHSTETSKFYQVAGRRVDEGMLMQQRNDFGIGLSLGYASGEIGGITGKAEYNVSTLLWTFTGKLIRIKQLKLFAEFGSETKEYNTPILVGAEDISFTRYDVGISKGYYFARNFSLTLFGAYGMEAASHDDFIVNGEETDLSTIYLNFGASLTANLTYNVQLFGTLNMYSVGDILDDDGNTLTLSGNDATYTDIFQNREGASFSVGLRLEF